MSGFKKGQLLEKMLMSMVQGHSGQLDRGGVPYALHPITVMQNLRTDDEELMAIALGHDLIEDTKFTWTMLRDIGMTERVIEGICALTKMPGESYEEYVNKVKSNPDAVLVKMQDLKHNTDLTRLKGISQKDMERHTRYVKFYAELKEIAEGRSK